MACSCGSGAAALGETWEARTMSGQTLEVAPGRTQGTKAEAVAAAKTTQGSYLVRV